MFKTNRGEPYRIKTVNITNNQAVTAAISCVHRSTITLCNPQVGLPCIKLPTRQVKLGDFPIFQTEYSAPQI